MIRASEFVGSERGAVTLPLVVRFTPGGVGEFVGSERGAVTLPLVVRFTPGGVGEFVGSERGAAVRWWCGSRPAASASPSCPSGVLLFAGGAVHAPAALSSRVRRVRAGVL